MESNSFIVKEHYSLYFCLALASQGIQTRVVVEAGTSETETETWVAETKTETEAI